MRENISQARRYREMVRIEFWRDPAYPDLTCNIAFRHYLQSKYKEEIKS